MAGDRMIPITRAEARRLGIPGAVAGRLRKESAPSHIEAELLAQIRLAGLPEPEREVQVIPGRKFRYDFCWRAQKLLVECQGGIWAKGHSGHSSGLGIHRDATKISLAQLHGYRCLVVTGQHVKDGTAIKWIAQALRSDRAGSPAPRA